MTDFTFITFATKGSVYEQYAENWRKNMKRLGLKHEVDIVVPPEYFGEGPEGYYKRWIGRKVRVPYIRSKLRELNKPLIWLDCDDGLKYRPELPDTEFDFGFFRNPTKAKGRLPIIAGLLAFYPTKNAFHFLDVWDYLCFWDDLEPMGGNHIRLIHALNICCDKEAVRLTGFKTMNLTPYFERSWKLDGNKT